MGTDRLHKYTNYTGVIISGFQLRYGRVVRLCKCRVRRIQPQDLISCLVVDRQGGQASTSHNEHYRLLPASFTFLTVRSRRCPDAVLMLS